MNLHPDIEALLEMVQAGTESGARTPFPQLTAVQARADFDASSPLLDIDPPALACERHLSLPMRDGAMIAARLYAQEEPNSRLLTPRVTCFRTALPALGARLGEALLATIPAHAAPEMSGAVIQELWPMEFVPGESDGPSLR